MGSSAGLLLITCVVTVVSCFTWGTKKWRSVGAEFPALGQNTCENIWRLYKTDRVRLIIQGINHKPCNKFHLKALRWIRSIGYSKPVHRQTNLFPQSLPFQGKSNARRRWSRPDDCPVVALHNRLNIITALQVHPVHLWQKLVTSLLGNTGPLMTLESENRSKQLHLTGVLTAFVSERYYSLTDLTTMQSYLFFLPLYLRSWKIKQIR